MLSLLPPPQMLSADKGVSESRKFFKIHQVGNLQCKEATILTRCLVNSDRPIIPTV